jgi:hypothetical protein
MDEFVIRAFDGDVEGEGDLLFEDCTFSRRFCLEEEECFSALFRWDPCRFRANLSPLRFRPSSQFQLPVLDNDILEAMEDYSVLFLHGVELMAGFGKALVSIIRAKLANLAFKMWPVILGGI